MSNGIDPSIPNSAREDGPSLSVTELKVVRSVSPEVCGVNKGTSLLFHHNLILDLVVGRLRNDLLLYQLIRALVGTTVDDFGRLDVTDPLARL